jgi:hypothetical protein
LPYHVAFFGLLGISEAINSSINKVVFIAELEVAEIPDCE